MRHGCRQSSVSSRSSEKERVRKGPLALALSRLALSLDRLDDLQSVRILISESPGNSFGPTYVRTPAYLARQTDTRLVSINHQRSDSAAEEKSPPNEASERARARARRPMRAPLSRRAGPIGEVIRKIGKKKCAIRSPELRTVGRTRTRVMDRKKDCFPSRARFCLTHSSRANISKHGSYPYSTWDAKTIRRGKVGPPIMQHRRIHCSTTCQ